jgi:hypothetical protein
VHNLAPKQAQKWLRKHVFGWSILAAVIFTLGVYFDSQTVRYCRLRPMLLRSPDAPPRGWSSVPQPLTDTVVSMAEGTTLSYYGYSFDVPWRAIDKERNEGRAVELFFKTGQTIRFYNPEYSDRNPIDGVASHVDRNDFRLAFGPEVRQSKYKQFSAVISASPSQLSPFCSHREFARTLVLLEIKGLWFEHGKAAADIFSFETDTYRGFEISSLSHDWQNVALDLFDKTGRHWFAITIDGDARSGVRLTQPEINRVIRSFRTAPSLPPNRLGKNATSTPEMPKNRL